MNFFPAHSVQRMKEMEGGRNMRRTAAALLCVALVSLALLIGRKAMTILDSILKSRDTTLPIKLHLVKAMIFPVAM